jgi:4-hydroxybenzoate polyprenyltransferase
MVYPAMMRLVPPPQGSVRACDTTAQLLAAAAVMVGGAWLISLWMVGVVLMVAGLDWGGRVAT